MAPNQDASNQSGDFPNPTSAKIDSRSGQPSQDEDGFVDIHHEDVEMQDSDSDAVAPPPKTSLDSLDLQRIGRSDEAEEVGEEDDDSEDENDIMASHPLLNMLTGRLGQRRRGSSHKWDSLHPENQALSASNVDECSMLEEEAFPVEERASREKVQVKGLQSLNFHHFYRLFYLSDEIYPVSISIDEMSRVKLGAFYPANKS